MNRIGVWLTIGLISPATLATGSAPRVGDFAKYRSEFRDSQIATDLTEWSKEIVEDFGNGTVLIELTAESDVFRTTAAKNALGHIADLKTFCKKQNRPDQPARLERVTVNAGTFDACRVTITSTSITVVWYASEVPFGVIKKTHVASDKSIEIQELLDYRRP